MDQPTEEVITRENTPDIRKKSYFMIDIRDADR